MKTSLRKILSFVMVLCFAFICFFGVNVNAAVSYTECEFGEGTFLITTTSDGNNYYLPATTTSSAPTAKSFSSVEEISTDHLWVVTSASEANQYYIKNSEGEYLYSTSSNNGVRVGDTEGTWTYDKTKNSLMFTAHSRYLGIYNNADWRTYTTLEHNNFKNDDTTYNSESFKFYSVSETAEKSPFEQEETNASLNVTYTVEEGVSAQRFVKVTEEKDDWSGTYLIVAADQYVFTAVDGVNTYASATVKDGIITNSDALASYTVEIASMTGGYSIKTPNGYSYGSSGSNKLTFNETEEQLNTIAFDDENDIFTIKSGEVLAFNATAGQYRFRYYKESTVTDNTTYYFKVALYELKTVTATSYNITNAALRFGAKIDATLYGELFVEGVKFGVELSVEGYEVKSYVCTPIPVNAEGIEDENGEYYQFAVVINEIDAENYDLEITGRCYVEDAQGNKTYMASKTYSVKTISQKYIDDALAPEHEGVLGYLAQ